MRALLPRCTAAASTALAVALLAPPVAQATDAAPSPAPSTSAEVESAREQVAELGRDVEAATAEYDAVAARLEAQQARTAAAQAQVASQEEAIAAMQAVLGDLAVETFKRGGVDPQLSALVGGDPGDYAQTSSTLTLLGERQSVSLTDVKEAQVQLREAQEVAESELAEVTALEADLATRRAAIEKRLADAEDLLAFAEAEHQARLRAEEARARSEASRSARARASAPVDAVQATGTGELSTPVAGRRSSPFGYRIHPVYGTSKLHSGLDIAAGCGTPVVAADDGVVSSASWNGSYGNIVVVEHGSMSTAYAHLEGFAVTSGPVSKGETIGFVGTTGVSTGCHLHFEVRLGSEQVDPARYL